MTCQPLLERYEVIQQRISSCTQDLVRAARERSSRLFEPASKRDFDSERPRRRNRLRLVARKCRKDRRERRGASGIIHAVEVQRNRTQARVDLLGQRSHRRIAGRSPTIQCYRAPNLNENACSRCVLALERQPNWHNVQAAHIAFVARFEGDTCGAGAKRRQGRIVVSYALRKDHHRTATTQNGAEGAECAHIASRIDARSSLPNASVARANERHHANPCQQPRERRVLEQGCFCREHDPTRHHPTDEQRIH